MKSAAVLTVDKAFAFLIFFVSISAAKGMAALKCPRAREFAIQECSCHARGFTRLGGGGMSGGVGSPKIDWCIINL